VASRFSCLSQTVHAIEGGWLFSPDVDEWHHWVMKARSMVRNIQRTGERSTGARALCSIVLGLFLVTVHAPHFSAPEAHVAMAMGAVDHAIVWALPGEHADAMDCPFPDLVSPQINSLVDQPMLDAGFITVLPLALSVSSAVYSNSSPARCPRPPGPTRQAVLQRFTL
jgi:hypothetical protein